MHWGHSLRFQICQFKVQNACAYLLCCNIMLLKGEDSLNQSGPGLHPKHGFVGIMEPLNAEQLPIRSCTTRIEIECALWSNHKNSPCVCDCHFTRNQKLIM